MTVDRYQRELAAMDEDMRALFQSVFVQMTAEDLGGMTDGDGARWPFCVTGDCPSQDAGPCRVYGQCFYFGRPT